MCFGDSRWLPDVFPVVFSWYSSLLLCLSVRVCCLAALGRALSVIADLVGLNVWIFACAVFVFAGRLPRPV
jgi:hypothetical protein